MAYDEYPQLLPSKLRREIKRYQLTLSLNVDGRCEKIKGEGEITAQMPVMADVHLECETCQAKD